MHTHGDQAELNKRVQQETRNSIAEHHAAGHPTVHGDRRGLYMLFPDQGVHYYPADCFPVDQSKRTGYFLRWVEFMKGLYLLLNDEEWTNVSLEFGPHDHGQLFVVNIAPRGLSPEHWQAAYLLAERIGNPRPIVVSR